MKPALFLMVGVIVIGMNTSACRADRNTVVLRAGDVDTRSPADERFGDYFVIPIDIPAGVSEKRLVGAILEFYLDVDTRIDSVYVEEEDTSYTVIHSNLSPALEVYALTGTLTGTPTSSVWRDDLKFAVPVPLGSRRLVKIDITSLVKRYIRFPSENHGVVVGSLTNERDGIFTVRDGVFASGIKARVRYIY